MTDKAAADLRIQLDAMRMARAEDAKTCARLTARVKELEAEVAQAKSDLDVHRWAIHDSGILDGDNVSLKRLMVEALRRKGYEFSSGYTGLADGTRDEKAARCWVCSVPIPNGANRCALHVRVNSCPPGGDLKECNVAACWKHGDIP
jgi:hypothetical protein